MPQRGPSRSLLRRFRSVRASRWAARSVIAWPELHQSPLSSREAAHPSPTTTLNGCAPRGFTHSNPPRCHLPTANGNAAWETRTTAGLGP
jgi:hypothetical protein